MGTRVVLDTNVLLSGFGWQGIPHAILREVVRGEIRVVTSSVQLSELKRVLQYPKFALTYQQQNRIIEVIENLAELVEVRTSVKLVDDPYDNHMVTLAIDAHAEFLITGDKELLRLKEYRTVLIASPMQFWKLYSSH